MLRAAILTASRGAVVPESLRTRVAAEARQFSFFFGGGQLPLDNPRDRRCRACWHKRNSPCPLRQRISGEVAASEKKSLVFFFWGVKLGKMTELNYDVAFCCISYYMFLLELFSHNCKNTEDRILISLFGRFRDCLSLLKPPEGYSKSVPINV